MSVHPSVNYYKSNLVLLHATTGTSLEKILKKKKSRTLKGAYHPTLFMQSDECVQVYKEKKLAVVRS